MAKLITLLCLLLISAVPPAYAVSLQDRIKVLEQRVIDLERLQNEHMSDTFKRIEQVEKRSKQLTQGYRGFFDELEAFREDLQQVGGNSEHVERGKRKLSSQLEELSKKLDAQAVELFELKELLKAQANAKPTAAPIANAGKAFNKAMVQFKKGKWEPAKQGFLSLAQQQPKHKLAPDALYYGAFAAFMLKEWKLSNRSFSDLISLYPKSKRVLPSRWRLALGHLKTKNPGAAKTQLKKLTKQKKNKKLAAKARAKLKQLK